jgi:hypothetical protein
METALKVHETYLPFTADQLQAHFAKVTGTPLEREAYTRYYSKSAERYRAWKSAPAGVPRQRPRSLDVQVEKGERFWTVAALMGLFHVGNRVKDLGLLLERAFPEGACPVESFDTWADALGEDVELFLRGSHALPGELSEAPQGAPRGARAGAERTGLGAEEASEA